MGRARASRRWRSAAGDRRDAGCDGRGRAEAHGERGRKEGRGGGVEGSARDSHAVRGVADHVGNGRGQTVTNVRSSNQQVSAAPARRMTRLVLYALAVMVGLGLVATPIDAQDDRAAARDIVKKWQGAIVNVRVVLKMRVSVGGREMQSMDESVETVGTVIDPSGLTVLSLGALNPGTMMNRLMGGGSGQERMEFGSEPT